MRAPSLIPITVWGIFFTASFAFVSVHVASITCLANYVNIILRRNLPLWLNLVWYQCQYQQSRLLARRQ